MSSSRSLRARNRSLRRQNERSIRSMTNITSSRANIRLSRQFAATRRIRCCFACIRPRPPFYSQQAIIHIKPPRHLYVRQRLFRNLVYDERLNLRSVGENATRQQSRNGHTNDILHLSFGYDHAEFIPYFAARLRVCCDKFSAPPRLCARFPFATSAFSSQGGRNARKHALPGGPHKINSRIATTIRIIGKVVVHVKFKIGVIRPRIKDKRFESHNLKN